MTAEEGVAGQVSPIQPYPPRPDHDLLLRALELYQEARLDLAEAYLAALAELSGIGAVASFDRSLDRIPTIRRIS